MGDVVDSFGQWLTQLPVLGQTAVLLGILLPVGGVVAFGFIGLIDIVVGLVSRRWGSGRSGNRGAASHWSTWNPKQENEPRRTENMRNSRVKMALLALILLVIIAGLLTQM